MGKIVRLKVALTLLFSFWINCGLANIHKLKEGSLLLSPESCYLKNEQSSCKINITASWKLTSPDNYCLFISTRDEPLKCWNNKNQGKLTAKLEVNNSVRFLLKRNDGPLMFEKRLIIYRQIKNLRKKRRNPWSFY